MSNPNPNTSPDAGARPTLGHNASASSSTMPLFPTTGHTPSPSGSSHSASASNSYFPGATPRQGDHSRMDSEAISWIAPEDFDPTSLFDAPIPRPHSAGHIPRVRSLSFGAASSLMGPHTPGGRDGAPSPYGLNPREGTSLRAASALGLNGGERPGSVALSINYTPSKFSDALAVGPRRRRRPKDLSRNPSDSGPNATEVEKLAMARGGGVDAFRKGESRMPDDRDDLHPVTSRQGFFDRADMKSRWTRFKVVLFVFNIAYTIFALAGVIAILLIWLDILPRADIIRVANRPELIFTTLAAATALLTATIGWAGVMLNNRSFLAVYCLLLWFSFAFLVTPGYITYRHWSLNLQAKLNQAWSEDYSVSDRRRIQNALHCCGYFSPFVEASISATCYARSVLSGCKGPYFKYEHGALRIWWTVIFSLVGFHIILIAASLLCANHVTYRFGKGMMPKAYRLTSEAVAAIMENYAEQLGQEYGEGVARAFVERNSRAPSMVDLTDPNGAGSMSGHLRGVSARLDSIYGHQRNESGLGSVYSAGGDGNGSGSGRAGYGHLRAESYGDMGRMRGQSLHDPFAGGEMGVRMLDPQGDLRMDPMGMATSSSGGHSTSAGHSSSSMGLLLGTGAGTGGSGGGKYGTIEGTMPETAM